MRYDIVTHLRAEKYLAKLLESERALVSAHMYRLGRGEFSAVHTKKLYGPIRELIVGNHRLLYFCIGQALYFSNGFRKKSRKTPKAEITYAYRTYIILKKQS